MVLPKEMLHLLAGQLKEADFCIALNFLYPYE